MNRELVYKISLVAEYQEKKDVSEFNPHDNWNDLMPVCKKINESYFGERQDIYRGQNDADIDATFEAVVKFIEFWNDPNREKTTWSNSPEWAIAHAKKQRALALGSDREINGL